MAIRKSDVVSTKMDRGDDCEGMPVTSRVYRGDGSGNEELDVAGRPAAECLTVSVSLL